MALGRAHHQAGALELAEQIYRQVLAAVPAHAEALQLLGVIAHQRGLHDQAARLIEQAVAADPARPDFFSNLGETYRAMGRRAEAAAALERALQLKPDYARACYNLGLVHQDAGDVRQAAACYRRAIEIDPAHARSYNNLGVLLVNGGELDAGIEVLQTAVGLQPDYADAWNNLGSARHDQGDTAAVLDCYRRAMSIEPGDAEVHSNFLLTLQHRSGITPEALSTAHAEYQRRHAAPLRAAWRPHQNVRDPERVLRLGFVSGDFNRHPVAFFIVRALENLDRGRFHVTCYSDVLEPDAMTERVRRAADTWRPTLSLSHAELAEQVRRDRIDILFDLAGHTAHNRLLAFARRPAPIQITWLGYVGTTGLEAMDYLLADACEVPAEAERYACERVLRMPDAYVCFDPPGAAPEPGPLPGLAQGRLTFGCFNRAAKISAEIAAAWGEILRRAAGARLLIKSFAVEAASAQDYLRRLLDAQGVPLDRVDFEGGASHEELLASYNRIDVALDTFPYSGGLTTCEALWMGVPVVTVPGATFAGRHSLTHLTAAGLTETIAPDLPGYVDLAVRLGADLPRLAELRAGLREQVARSPLCDGPRFAAHLSEVLLSAWRHWLQSDPFE